MATAERQIVVEDALSAGGRALVQDPKLLESLSVEHLLSIGRELRAHYPELALLAHSRAVERTTGKTRAHALVSLASTLRCNQKPSEALDAISEALELDDSPHLSLTANTCRVGALRDLGELSRARVLGERLEESTPDDPKVLRALAAVYGALGAPEESARADLLFALANELDALHDEEFRWSDLKHATPQLDELLDDAARLVDPGEPTFCAFDEWINAFRPRLDAIASSQRADPRLQSNRAYELVALLVFRRLPACRECGRLYSD